LGEAAVFGKIALDQVHGASLRFDETKVRYESPGCTTINDSATANGIICIYLTGNPLGCSSISLLNSRKRRRQETQFRLKPIDLCQFKTTHSDALPTLRHSGQCGKDQLRTTLLIKENRNRLRPMFFLLRGPPTSVLLHK